MDINNIYIIKDWAGNVMTWGNGEYASFDDAAKSIERHIEDRLIEEGINVHLTYGLENDYPAFEEILDKIRADYAAEYWIDAVNPKGLIEPVLGVNKQSEEI